MASGSGENGGAGCTKPPVQAGAEISDSSGAMDCSTLFSAFVYSRICALLIYCTGWLNRICACAHKKEAYQKHVEKFHYLCLRFGLICALLIYSTNWSNRIWACIDICSTQSADVHGGARRIW